MPEIKRLDRWWLLPILSGVFLLLSTATFDVGFFAWIGLVPLFFFLNNPAVSSKHAIYGSVFAGSLYGIAVLWPLHTLNAWWWFSPPSEFLWNNKGFLLIIVLIFVAVIAGGLFFGIFAYLYRKFRRGDLVDVFIFSILWSLLERLREPLVVGFTWGHLGYNVHDYTYAMQSAALADVYGVSAVVIAVNMLIYFSFRHALACRHVLSESNWLLSVRTIFIHRFFIALILFIGIVNLSGYLAVHGGKRHNDSAVRVAVIHSPFTTEGSAMFENYEQHLSLLETTLQGAPELVVLPENVFPFFVIDKETEVPLKYEFTETPLRGMFDKLTALSREHSDTAFIFGVHTTDGEQRFNSLAVMERGVITSLYDKRVLLPLAEHVPQSLKKSHVEPLSEGAERQPIFAHGLSITPLICSEVIYPRAISQDSVVVNISNDSIFESPVFVRQHHIMAKVRAIESGNFLLRSTKRGISSIIDPYGREVAVTVNPDGDILTATIYR